jgi:chromosome segregation ATPase
LSEKQDRQGARTPADLERKWQFGKKFAEIMGIATDARDKVDSVESELRSEIAEQYTKISRDTEKIVMEALTEYVNTSDYDKFQQTVSAQFKIMSDQISANLKSTTELITSVSGEVSLVDSNLQETKESLDSVSSDLQGTKEELDSVSSDLQGTKENLDAVDQDLQEAKGSLDSVNQDLQDTKENLTAVEQSINKLGSDLSEYTVATDGFKETVTTELTEAVNRLSGVEGDITETNESLSSLDSDLQGTKENLDSVNSDLQGTKESLNGVNDDLQTVKGDLELHYEANSKFQEQCESEFSATAKQISLNMESTTDSFTEVNARIETTEGDVVEQHRFTEELREYCESEFAASAESLDLKFQSATEQITNINGDVQTISEDLQKHFEFSANGLAIKAGESEMKLRIDNDLIAFYKGDIDESDLAKNRFGWWDGVNFHTGNIVIKVEERA